MPIAPQCYAYRITIFNFHMDESNRLLAGSGRYVALAVLVLLAVFLFALTLKTFKEYHFVGGGVPVSNVISVSGEGEAFGVPDVAEFTFSVIEEGQVVSTVQASATTRANAAKEFLEGAGIDEKDIKTVGYNISPRYQYGSVECLRYPCPPQTPTIDGYTVTETVSVKVRDISKAGELVSGIGSLGVQNVSNVSFMIDDPDFVTAEARAMAIEEAKAKAMRLADDLGVTLVRIVNFSEGYGGYPVPMYARDSAVMAATPESAPVPELSPGESKVTSSVTITYEIR
mgnify:FL=1